MGSILAAAVRLLHGRRQKLDAETETARQARTMDDFMLVVVVVWIGKDWLPDACSDSDYLGRN